MKFYAFNTTDNVTMVDGELMKFQYCENRRYEKVDVIEIDTLQDLLNYIDSREDGKDSEVIVYRKHYIDHNTNELVSTDKWCIEYYNDYRE